MMDDNEIRQYMLNKMADALQFVEFIGGGCVIIALALMYWMWWQNKRIEVDV